MSVRMSLRNSQRSGSLSVASGRRASGGHVSMKSTLCLQQNGPWPRPAATLKRDDKPGPPVFSTRISSPRRSRSQSADERLKKALQKCELEDLRDAFSKSLNERREHHVTNSRNVLRVQLMIMKIHDRKLKEAMEADEVDMQTLRILIKDAEDDEAIASRGKSMTVAEAKRLLEQKEKELRRATGGQKQSLCENPELQAAEVSKIKSKMKAAAYDNGKVNWEKLAGELDHDRSGGMCFEEFQSSMRKIGKVDPNNMSESDLRQLFSSIAKEKGDTINFMAEFVPWLEEQPEKKQ